MEEYDFNRISVNSFCKLDEDVDSFQRIRNVKSDLVFGDPMIAPSPWLSVVIPTYRRETQLREAIESVLSQKAEDFSWEIIVVDNTPLDAEGQTPALKIIREIGNLSVLYYHNRENIGSGYNWNRGVELAMGEWVVFLHDDDVLFPSALENIGRQIRTYHGRKPLGYIYARRENFSSTMRPFRMSAKRRYPAESLTRFGVLISGCTGAGAPTCGTAILKQAFLETGGVNYDFGPSADEVLVYQIMRRYAVVLSNHVLGGYRWGENESLRKETLLQMIRADELLAQYTYSLSPFAQWWGKAFGDASSWRNIYRKQKIARKNGIVIEKKAFAAATTYEEPIWLKQQAFFLIYAFYRLCRFGKSFMSQKMRDTMIR